MLARHCLAAVLAVLLLPPLALAQSNVYRWVDKDGKVQYSDVPPPQEAKGVSQKRLGGGTVETPQLPFATQLAMKSSPAVLYVAADCGDYCNQGRALLTRRGIPFSERNIGNPADAEAVRKLVGSVFVPVLTLGDKVTKGFSEDSWQAALDAAGYPRTALPGQVNPKAPPPAPAPAPTPASGDKAPAAAGGAPAPAGTDGAPAAR